MGERATQYLCRPGEEIRVSTVVLADPDGRKENIVYLNSVPYGFISTLPFLSSNYLRRAFCLLSRSYDTNSNDFSNFNQHFMYSVGLPHSI